MRSVVILGLLALVSSPTPVKIKAAILGPEFRIDSAFKVGFTNEYGPVLASNGSSYLVAWRDVEGMFVNHLYAVLLPAGTINHTLKPLDFGGAIELGQPVVASNGQDHLLSWVEPTNAPPRCEQIYRAVVQSNGTVMSPPELPNQPYHGFYLSLASVPPNYFLAWQGPSVMAQAGRNAIYAIDGTGMSGSGMVLSPPPLAHRSPQCWQAIGRIIFWSIGPQPTPSFSTIRFMGGYWMPMGRWWGRTRS